MSPDKVPVSRNPRPLRMMNRSAVRTRNAIKTWISSVREVEWVESGGAAVVQTVYWYGPRFMDAARSGLREAIRPPSAPAAPYLPATFGSARRPRRAEGRDD